MGFFDNIKKTVSRSLKPLGKVGQFFNPLDAGSKFGEFGGDKKGGNAVEAPPLPDRHNVQQEQLDQQLDRLKKRRGRRGAGTGVFDSGASPTASSTLFGA